MCFRTPFFKLSDCGHRYISLIQMNKKFSLLNFILISLKVKVNIIYKISTLQNIFIILKMLGLSLDDSKGEVLQTKKLGT